jgi:hypothetical protein
MISYMFISFILLMFTFLAERSHTNYWKTYSLAKTAVIHGSGRGSIALIPGTLDIIVAKLHGWWLLRRWQKTWNVYEIPSPIVVQELGVSLACIHLITGVHSIEWEWPTIDVSTLATYGGNYKLVSELVNISLPGLTKHLPGWWLYGEPAWWSVNVLNNLVHLLANTQAVDVYTTIKSVSVIRDAAISVLEVEGAIETLQPVVSSLIDVVSANMMSQMLVGKVDHQVADLWLMLGGEKIGHEHSVLASIAKKHGWCLSRTEAIKNTYTWNGFPGNSHPFLSGYITAGDHSTCQNTCAPKPNATHWDACGLDCNHVHVDSLGDEALIGGSTLLDLTTLRIVPMRGQPYVAVSYVWFHRLISEGNVHMCLIDKLRDVVDTGSLPRLVWIDAYAIAKGHANKRLGLEQMADIYSRAEATLILDRGCYASGKAECLAQLAVSDWAGRAWTLAEAIVSRRLLVVAIDGAHELEIDGKGNWYTHLVSIEKRCNGWIDTARANRTPFFILRMLQQRSITEVSDYGTILAAICMMPHPGHEGDSLANVFSSMREVPKDLLFIAAQRDARKNKCWAPTGAAVTSFLGAKRLLGTEMLTVARTGHLVVNNLRQYEHWKISEGCQLQDDESAWLTRWARGEADTIQIGAWSGAYFGQDLDPKQPLLLLPHGGRAEWGAIGAVIQGQGKKMHYMGFFAGQPNKLLNFQQYILKDGLLGDI